jgi:anti-sigma B factor antagonist
MKIERKSEGKHAVVLALSGNIQGGPDADVFHDAIRELVDEGRTNILLDMGRVKWINSTGLGILIRGFSTIQKTGGAMKIFNLSERIDNLFSTTKLNIVFEVFENEVSALRSFKPAEGAPADSKAD